MADVAEDVVLKPAELLERLGVVGLGAVVRRLAALGQVAEGGEDSGHLQVPLAGGQQLVGAVQAGTIQIKQVLKARKLNHSSE